jgi:hypothetical protein
MNKYLLLGIAIMSGSMLSKLMRKNPSLPEKTTQEVLEEKEMNELDAALKQKLFMGDTSFLESSSNQNTNHKVMPAGIHAGQKAIGQYGLMPNTINEMSNRMKSEGMLPKEIKLMREMNLSDQEIADKVAQDPELEQTLADRLYQHVNKRFNGNEEQMNHAWQHGHNLSPDKLTPEVLEASPRTQKFRRLRDQIRKK